MKKYAIISLLLAVAISSCLRDTADKKTAENYPIDQLFADYYHQKAALYPLDATMAGNNDFDYLLTNTLSKDYLDSLIRFYDYYQNLLLLYKDEDLSAEQQISKNILRWECDINLSDLNAFLPSDSGPLFVTREAHAGLQREPERFGTAWICDGCGEAEDASVFLWTTHRDEFVHVRLAIENQGGVWTCRLHPFKFPREESHDG